MGEGASAPSFRPYAVGLITVPGQASCFREMNYQFCSSESGLNAHFVPEVGIADDCFR